MSRPTSNQPDQSSTLRNLKRLVVVLVVSNLLVGGIGVYLLRSVDRRYSELVGRSVPALNDLRELMSHAVEAMRSTNPSKFVGPNTEAATALLHARQHLATAQKFRDEVLEDGYFLTRPASTAAILKAGQEFEQVGAEISRLYALGNLAEVSSVRGEKLLPAFDRYVAAIGSAADAVEANSLATSKDYAARTNSFSALVLGVASWPVLVLFGLLALTAMFVVAMMIAFRGKDLADMP